MVVSQAWPTVADMNVEAPPQVAAPGVEPVGAEVGAAGPTLSPSRAADFMTCPLLYRFRTIDRLPEPPSTAATRGTVVHAVLERLFDLPPDERTVVRAAAMVGPQWQRLLEAEPDLAALFGDDQDGSALAEWIGGAEELVRCYFTLEDPARLEPAERELYVETVLDSGLRLRGHVDRVDRASGTGDLRVVDYKTGKAPPEGFEQRAMFQMRFYALALWRLYQRVPRLLQLVYLGSGEVLRYHPDEADLLATERKVQALWRAIERAARTGDWRPSPSKLCEWCAHQALCPSWGGTPPPLPEPEATGSVVSFDEAPSPRMSPIDV